MAGNYVNVNRLRGLSHDRLVDVDVAVTILCVICWSQRGLLATYLLLGALGKVSGSGLYPRVPLPSGL